MESGLELGVWIRAGVWKGFQVGVWVGVRRRVGDKVGVGVTAWAKVLVHPRATAPGPGWGWSSG